MIAVLNDVRHAVLVSLIRGGAQSPTFTVYQFLP